MTLTYPPIIGWEQLRDEIAATTGLPSTTVENLIAAAVKAAAAQLAAHGAVRLMGFAILYAKRRGYSTIKRPHHTTADTYPTRYIVRFRTYGALRKAIASYSGP